MNLTENSLTIISILITIISIVINIIQFFNNKKLKEVFQMMLQTNYNAFFRIARSCSRVQNKKPNTYEKRDDISYINGIVDAARIAISATSTKLLKEVVLYEHPIYPYEKEKKESKINTSI